MSDMFSALEERIECLQKKDQEYTIKYQKFDEEVAIVTPLMKRVHKLVNTHKIMTTAVQSCFPFK